MEQKNNTATLFINDKKRTNNSPDYTGKAIIDDQEVRVSAWQKTAKNGSVYLSLAFTKPTKEAGDSAPF